ncbi:cytochrome b/b6 domain-containing protein [Campylobacter sp. US33a]|uniref:cytochrome b/b6 domain-containing protein n=1 Tax=Campylobacter sp. US33a TaxID=2498120 RepID=UPI0010676CB4|nr:cytochrome b/b6 domain-containing protein [Campylobacter sp. US33a]TEY03036.1 cytochrome B [Campylobacter sp. US33a]
MTKSYIWTFVNRFLHVLLIVTFLLSYLFSDFDNLFYYHALLGVLFFAIIAFRIIWGFVGTKYSLFKDFQFKGLAKYLFSILAIKEKHIGHNPASSIAIILMLILGILIFISGMLALGVEERAGFFAKLYFTYDVFSYIKDLHEFFVNFFVFVVVIHILGVLIDKFYNKADALDSMIHGYKNTNINESVSLNIFQKIFFASFLLFFIALFFYLLYPKNQIIGIKDLKYDFSYMQNEDYSIYQKECGSCHIAYVSYLLPKKAWNNIMNNLENHFGDDASLDEMDRKAILSFLEKNSMEEFNTKFKANLKNENVNEIAITNYNFYKRTHRKIPEEVFHSTKVKSRANCQNCHQFAQEGFFSKSQII